MTPAHAVAFFAQIREVSSVLVFRCAMAWCIWGDLLFVGTAQHAKDWAWHHADAIVNCAQKDFEYTLKDMHQHRWLHI